MVLNIYMIFKLISKDGWKGADKWDIQGLLIRPPDTNLTGSVPMVTVVHGGPTAVHAYQYYASQGWLQLLANSGIAVFLPNPRGSTGWGLEFAESNIGDMGGKDWEDIEKRLSGFDRSALNVIFKIFLSLQLILMSEISGPPISAMCLEHPNRLNRP